MTDGKQLQMIMRDMLFVTWAVQPERARRFIGERLELDTLTDSEGREFAFASAVCFNVSEVRSNVLPIGRLSFEQVNYRIYVRAGEVPAVCFLDMKVNSRMLTTLTSFLRLPVDHEEITINAFADGMGSVKSTIHSQGLMAEAIAGRNNGASNLNVPAEFITDRLVGYVLAGDSMFRIEVEHARLESVAAQIVSARAPRFEQLGLLDAMESTRPHSALYVREACFEAKMPTRES